MAYFTRHKVGNGSSKYDHNPKAFDKDVNNSRQVRSEFKNDFCNLLNKKYYIEKETSYGRYLHLEEKIEIIINEIYDIRTKSNQ